jgi:predicted dehydrogenase
VNEIYGAAGTMRLEPDGIVAVSRLNAEWENFPSAAGAGLRNVFANFVDVLTKGAVPLASGADGLRILRVVRAGYASSLRGEVVRVADFDE